MTWRAYLIQTATGQVGKELDLGDGAGSGTVPLCDVPELSLTVHKSVLTDVDPSWLRPWAGGVLVTYETDGHPETPIMAGPITDIPAETATTITVPVRGIEEVLAHRYLLDRDYAATDQVGLVRSSIWLKDSSRSLIMRRLLKYATGTKARGDLPILVDMTGDTAGPHELLLYGWDLANNVAWSRLLEQSEAPGGPDFAFVPEWADASRASIRWRFVHGTEADPRLPAVGHPVFDATAPEGPVETVAPVAAALGVAHRCFGTGAGEGAGTLTVMRERVPEDPGMPLMEALVSDTSEEIGGVSLDDKVKARIRDAVPRVQLTAEVRADTTHAPLGSYRVGDQAVVIVDGWTGVPAGELRRWIIAIKFDLGSDTVTVELQDDPDEGDDETW